MLHLSPKPCPLQCVLVVPLIMQWRLCPRPLEFGRANDLYLPTEYGGSDKVLVLSQGLKRIVHFNSHLKSYHHDKVRASFGSLHRQ